MTLWGGRFSQAADDLLRRLNDSIIFDRRLYREDITGSIAYAQALVPAAVLTSDEAATIVAGLQKILVEFDEGQFVLAAGDEDIHTAVERRLVEIVGAVGGRLHTGRSRNDQVATDLRLWLRSTITRLQHEVTGLQEALMGQALHHAETLLPGYTHMQPAQPITVGHWLMSFAWMLQRDQTRLTDCGVRADEMPLGSGALSGTPYAIDREALAETLGFARVTPNSLDAVSDRDAVAELMFVLALLATHLSRLAEDILIYSNPAFGFVTLDDRYSTGSSIMPQKRNADPMELTRGKTGRIIGHLSGFLTTMKGLPSGYNKDLQEDKEMLFDACDTMLLLLPMIAAIVASLHVNADAMRRALNEDMLATEIADYLVGRGLPFREAHHVVGSLVRLADEKGVALSRLPLDELQAQSPLFEADVADVFDFDLAVARRRATGGTSPQSVRQQIEKLSALLQTD